MKSGQIVFDPSDEQGMLELMDCYGDSKTMYSGENEYGEPITMSIFEDQIVVVTSQRNGWLRKNVYHRDGTVEELYER